MFMLLSALELLSQNRGIIYFFILLTSERPGHTCLRPRYGVAELVWNGAHWTPEPLSAVVPPTRMPSLPTCIGSWTAGTRPSSLSVMDRQGLHGPGCPGDIHIQLGLRYGAVATGDSGHQGTGLPRPVMLSPQPSHCDVVPRVLARGQQS